MTGAIPRGGDRAMPVTLRGLLTIWWPLAASWLMMGLELPAVGAVMARLPGPSVNLAAYGGVVFPVSLVIEAPIIMLLAASTALSKDLESYLRLRRFMIRAALGLGAVHLFVSATPLYSFLVDRLLGVPEEIRGPARIGMLIMTPWTPMIAYRRFQQGLLIRFGRSRAVGVGTAVRLLTNATVLAAGYLAGCLSGIVVGTLAVVAGVTTEAVYAGIAARRVVRGPLAAAAPAAVPLTLRRFMGFYIPLAVTPLFTMLAHPIVSAAISRMPRAIDSLAVWPVLNGLVFTLRSVGFAFNEVVVVALDRPGARRALVRFTVLLAGAVTLGLFVMTATPAGRFWFSDVSALPPGLTELAVSALWISLLMPAFSVIHSLFQGDLVHAHRTRAVTEAMALYLASISAALWVGVRNGTVTGLFLGLAAVLLGNGVQAAWLWMRSRDLRTGAPPESP
ncbi:MAG: hypothetical protein ABIH26_15750 [Candidatus Eisenbacteria bacterium]